MGMNWLFEPTTDLPNKLGRYASEHFSPPNEIGNRFKGFMSGASEGAGNVLAGMTSPFGIATSLMGMPWMKGLGNAGRAMQSLGRLDEARGISPSMLPSELVGQTGQSIYNSARTLPNAARSLEDIAYEVVRTGNDPVRRGIAGGVDLAKMMANASRARGK